MKYTVVKQFSNGVIDNMFAFVFKWVDFAKMFVEFLWSFIDIWIAFFLIFYNAFMYVYYLFLFFIDRGAESSAGVFRLRGVYSKSSYIPRVEVTKGPSVVPPIYGRAAATPSRMTETAAAGLTSLRTAGARGTKRQVFRDFFGSLLDFFRAVGRALILPFKKLVLLFDRGAAVRKQREEEAGESKSLIDEYIKEYERRRR